MLDIAEDLEAAVRLHSMFADVEASQLFVAAHAQAARLFDDEKDNKSYSKRPRKRCTNTDNLHPQLAESAAVKQTCACIADAQNLLGIEQAAGQRAPRTANAVNAHRADGIVNLEDPVNEQHRHEHQHPAAKAD